jgi:hypothetical protein
MQIVQAGKEEYLGTWRVSPRTKAFWDNLSNFRKYYGLYILIWWIPDRIVLTNRLVQQFGGGLFGRNDASINVSDVNTRDLVQNSWEQLLGTGDIQVQSAATGLKQAEIEQLYSQAPQLLKKMLDDLKDGVLDHNYGVWFRRRNRIAVPMIVLSAGLYWLIWPSALVFGIYVFGILTGLLVLLSVIAISILLLLLGTILIG